MFLVICSIFLKCSKCCNGQLPECFNQLGLFPIKISKTELRLWYSSLSLMVTIGNLGTICVSQQAIGLGENKTSVKCANKNGLLQGHPSHTLNKFHWHHDEGGLMDTCTSCSSGPTRNFGTIISRPVPVSSRYASKVASSGIREGNGISRTNSPGGQCSGAGSANLKVRSCLFRNGIQPTLVHDTLTIPFVRVFFHETFTFRKSAKGRLIMIK